MPAKSTQKEYATKEELQQLTQGLQDILNKLASQQDLSLVKQIHTVKWEVLRVAVEKSTDFETLKTRLLAVL